MRDFFTLLVSMGFLLLVFMVFLIYLFNKLSSLYSQKNTSMANLIEKNRVVSFEKNKNVVNQTTKILNFLLAMNFLKDMDDFEEWKNLNLVELENIFTHINVSMDDFFSISSLEDIDLKSVQANTDVNKVNLLIEDFTHNNHDVFSIFNDKLNGYGSDYVTGGSYDTLYRINPATGLPMMRGSAVDVAGNPMGMDLNDSFSSGINDSFNDRF